MNTTKDIALRLIDWYAERGVTLVTSSRMARGDRTARLVVTADQMSRATTLVLASGDRPVLPPLRGLRPNGLPPGRPGPPRRARIVRHH